MVDKIEMSLDEIIKSERLKKKSHRGKRGAGVARRGALRRGVRRGVTSGSLRITSDVTGNNVGGGVLKGRIRGGIQKAKFARGDVNSAWKHDMYDGPKRGTVGATKLIVGNLDYGVSNTDIRELFNEFGALKKAAVHYDRSGRSLGTADVIFERRSDALKAIKQYNGVPLDGRAMSIQLATDIVNLSRGGTAIGSGPGKRRPISGGKSGIVAAKRAGGARRGLKRIRKASGVAGGSIRRKPPTAEELDAELDAYVNDMKA